MLALVLAAPFVLLIGIGVGSSSWRAFSQRRMRARYLRESEEMRRREGMN